VAQQLVAGAMAQGVVDHLELVQIDVKHCETPALIEDTLETSRQRVATREPSQLIQLIGRVVRRPPDPQAVMRLRIAFCILASIDAGEFGVDQTGALDASSRIAAGLPVWFTGRRRWC
jgi:hypothetical protein